jgi:hypothetical protein
MEYTVIRSDRRTLCIQIDREGRVIVRAPRRCAKSYIDQFVRDHAQWVEEHQAAAENNLKAQDEFLFRTGDKISFCGKTYTVRLAPGCKVRLGHEDLFLPSGEPEVIRKPFLDVCKRAALPWLNVRLDQWAEKMGLSYQDVKLSAARTRWGSCSRDGVIRISIFLLFAPEQAIDYVLVHELAHRRVFNHSAAFWQVVAQTMPDYDQWRRVLRQFQTRPMLRSLSK